MYVLVSSWNFEHFVLSSQLQYSYFIQKFPQIDKPTTSVSINSKRNSGKWPRSPQLQGHSNMHYDMSFSWRNRRENLEKSQVYLSTVYQLLSEQIAKHRNKLTSAAAGICFGNICSSWMVFFSHSNMRKRFMLALHLHCEKNNKCPFFGNQIVYF